MSNYIRSQMAFGMGLMHPRGIMAYDRRPVSELLTEALNVIEGTIRKPLIRYGRRKARCRRCGLKIGLRTGKGWRETPL